MLTENQTTCLKWSEVLMKRSPLLALAGLLVCVSLAPAAPTKKTPKEAFQAFHDLIGAWRGTGEPHGTREEKLKGFWQEGIRWRWQFKEDDCWLVASWEKSKHFGRGELRYLPDKDAFEFKVVTPAKETQIYEGKLKKKELTLDRRDAAAKKDHRIVVNMLHYNRYLYRYETKPADHGVFTPVFRVGATKQGVPFASEGDKPECIVSGGLGTMEVSHNGKTYHVCCTGCRDAFKDNPEKYIKEYEAKKKAKGE